MTTLLTNANCLTWDESGSDFVLHQGHLLLEESGVTLLQAGEPLPAADNLLDLRQRLVTSPLINCHHHFYSLPARGLVPAGPLSSFSDILEQLWWKLDSTLTLEAIRLAARQSIRESIRQGVLTVFDHHSSPSVTTGALSTIGTELDRFGLRGVLCHEVSDRNGEVVRNQQLAENLAFISDHLTHPSVRGMMGLHASFTLADTTLAKVAGAAIHIHLAEDLLDDQQSRELYGRSACQRLAEYDLLQRSSLLAHGNHLSGAALALLADSQSWLVPNPRS
ncbi:amidohydrolase family protein, partial [bacterium]|nr:amidohydrolase family protein [bacterium]